MASMMLGMFDWVADFFKALFDMIPKVMYLLYASLACVIDVFQLAFRKLAGLDVYYVDGKAYTGDIVTNFITGILGINADGLQYPILSTVFWSFIVFGLIMVFITTLVAIIKSHYSYDDKAAKGPMQYVYTAGKAVVNMAAVPIIVVLGLYLSQAILTAVDSLTSITSSSIVSMYGDKVSLLESVNTVKGATDDKVTDKTYVYYDMFGFQSSIQYGPNEGLQWVAHDAKQLALIGSTNQTFSGSLFRVAAYNANRVRLGTKREFLSGFGANELFANGVGDGKIELAADMIDTAFACNLHLKERLNLRYISSSTDENGVWASLKYFTNFHTQGASVFSKFNVGLVWYYYDLWNFNFIVGFAGIMICITIFINIIFGMISRLFTCIVLFLIAPPLFGLAPLDGGAAGGKWRSNFMKQVLMAYGAIAGMNLMFLILPYINTIDFFNIAIADLLMQTLIIIAGLITIKAIIALVSDIVGGADANKTGEGLAQETGKMAMAGLQATKGAAMIGAKAWNLTTGAALGVAGGLLGSTKAGKAVGSAFSTLGEKFSKTKLGGAASKIGGFVKAVPGTVANYVKNPRATIMEGLRDRSAKKGARAGEAVTSMDQNRGALQTVRRLAVDSLEARNATAGKGRREFDKELYKDMEATLVRGGYTKDAAQEWVRQFKKRGGMDKFSETMRGGGTKGADGFVAGAEIEAAYVLNKRSITHYNKSADHDGVAQRYRRHDPKRPEEGQGAGAGGSTTGGVGGFSQASSDQIYRAVKQGVIDGNRESQGGDSAGRAKLTDSLRSAMETGIRVQLQSETRRETDGTIRVENRSDYNRIRKEVEEAIKKKRRGE